MGGAFSSHLRKVLSASVSGALYIAKSGPGGAVHDNLLRGSQHKLVYGDAMVSVRNCPRIARITYGCKIAVWNPENRTAANHSMIRTRCFRFSHMKFLYLFRHARFPRLIAKVFLKCIIRKFRILWRRMGKKNDRLQIICHLL